MDLKLYNIITSVCLWLGVISAIVADRAVCNGVVWYACLVSVSIAGLVSIGTYFYHHHLVEKNNHRKIDFFASKE
jgi:cytochrome c oxidase assembly factor CtaG